MEPTPGAGDLREQVRALSERVERLERVLALQAIPPAAPLTPVYEARPEPDAPVLDACVDSPVPPSPPPEESPAPTDRSLEGLVGGRYYLAAGSIVVVIGMGLFLKLGYDQGWFRMADAWKCIWGALFGLALIGAGEVARRTINALASSGLSAAGLGSLYLACYAAHGFYHLVGPVTAFLLLVCTSALGIAVAVRARRALVAVLAMLGGYLAPLVLYVDPPSPAVMPMHLLALLGVGLGLSAWRHDVYRPLRTLAWWGSVLLGSVWLGMHGARHPLVALPFLALFWGCVHAELILSVRAGVPSSDDEPARRIRWSNARHAVTSVSTSSWCVLAGILTLRVEPVLPDWSVPAGATGVAALLALVLAGHLRVLRDSPRTDAQRLGAALAMQAGALLLTAVALAFTGSAEVVAWLALGVAAGGAGAWIGAPSLCLYSLVPLSIAAARLVTYDAFISRRAFTPTDVLGIALDRWSLLMISAAGAWAIAGLLALRVRDTFIETTDAPPSRRTDVFRATPVACVLAGTTLLLLSVLHPDSRGGAVSAAYLLLAVPMTLAHRAESRLHLQAVGAGVCLLGIVAWAMAYNQHQRWSEVVETGALVHPGAIVGTLGIVVSLALAAWHARARPAATEYARLMLAAGVVLAWAVSSLEVFRLAANFRAGADAQHGVLSVWWGLFAVMLLTAGFRWKNPAARYSGLALLGVATTKALVVDLADVSPGWRVVSVLGLGLLMLGVALVYSRMSARLRHAGSGK
jgi:uncharacterized membrane protein